LKTQFFINKTGVTGTMKNGKGKTVVLRADIDALPIQELNKVTYRSKRKNVMHACGHDLHIASLIGAADVLNQLKSLWKGTVVFLFQPHEEKEPGGAKRMIRQGAFPKKTDAVFGLHASPTYNTGKAAIKPGDDYSGNLFFDVTVKGKGGHGAEPEKTVDPIVCASAMILELQTLATREIPAYEPAVLSIGSIHAGTVRNIIPDEAVFQGTIRAFSEDVLDLFIVRVKSLLKSVATSFRADVTVKMGKAYPPGYNNPDLAKRMIKSFSILLGARRVITQKHPVMVSEDFSYFQKKAPGLYVHLGVRPPGKKRIPGLHNAHFLPDEESIKTGIAAHCGFVIEMLGAFSY
jgi:amidohydrolase